MSSASSVEARNERFRALVGDWPQTEAAPALRVRELRRSAMEEFRSLGFPTTKDEDWKYTSVKGIVDAEFGPATAQGSEHTASLLPELDCPTAVFVGGHFRPDLSSLDALPEGLSVLSLAAAQADGAPELTSAFADLTSPGSDGFAALNTAFHEDGALVRVAAGAQVREPLQLLFVATENAAVEQHPRCLVTAGKGSESLIFETHAGGPGSFTNAVAEFFLEPGARLQRVLLHGAPNAGCQTTAADANEAQYVTRTAARVGRDAKFHSCSVSLGGALVRNALDVELAEPGAECQLDGVCVASGREHVDNHLFIHHAVPHCSSSQTYRNALGGRAHGVFTGKVLVSKDAQSTQAHQSSRGLILSDSAQLDNRPQLVIHADDVKCTHGAAVGKMDEEAVFYLRSRGLGEDAARQLMSEAFCAEVLDGLPEGVLQDGLRGLVRQRLMSLASEANGGES